MNPASLRHGGPARRRRLNLCDECSELQLYLFGETLFVCHGRPLHLERRKAIVLLAFPAIAEQRHNREWLAALLWPDLDQQRV